MHKRISFGDDGFDLREFNSFVFAEDPRERNQFQLVIEASVVDKARQGHLKFLDLFEQETPIYGVTTGFGDSSRRIISRSQSESLQVHLIDYLQCGTGEFLPRSAVRAALGVRLHSLARGLSGVSPELLDRMRLYLEKDWLPNIPCRGSLGASGDLVPMAYMAQILQGKGEIEIEGRSRPMSELLKENSLEPYCLKPKEGLALVNTTAAMTGMALFNLRTFSYLLDLSLVASSWLCMALRGRRDSFDPLVNEVAKNFSGQSKVAVTLSQLLDQEDYATPTININGKELKDPIQDKYSLRCVPQILGPIWDTFEVAKSWMDKEADSVADNPIIDDQGKLSMGGNFYGGYIAHGMDFLKYCQAQLADLIDRQLMTVVDEKSNRGLPPNLVDWDRLPEDERFLHHGFKGVNQASSAMASEIISQAQPVSTLSRSAEAHNQDKVSLGMSAGVQCFKLMDPLYSLMAGHLACLAQALDLRGANVKGVYAKEIYDLVRSEIPFLERDQPLGLGIQRVSERLQRRGLQRERLIDHDRL